MKKVSFFRSIQLKFIIIYVLLVVIAVQIIGSYVSRELENDLLSNFKQSINDRVDLLNYNLQFAFNKDRNDGTKGTEISLQEDVQNIVTDVERSGSTKIKVIDSHGRVLGTNDYLNEDIIGKKTTEEFIQRAIKFGTTNEDQVLNSNTGERIFIRVEPIYNKDSNVEGVIYLESSLESVYNQISKINEIFLRGSLIALIISVILGVFVARAFTKPVIEMRKQAQTMARGDFSQKVKVYGNDEISQLAVTFNHLNDRLKHSMAAIEQEQRKLSSVLENMTEGVIASDIKGEITLVNEAAGRLFGENPNGLISKDLLQFFELDEKVVNIQELWETGSVILDFSDDEEEFLIRANFSPVYDDYKYREISGLITVLSDVTEDERIERERREFVSNVSHELRTPLTTLRSYLEALADGAWQDKEIAPKFLEVTQNETERMIRMVSSLLQLSRMDSKELSLHKEVVDFVTLFHNVIDRFEMNIKDGNIHFKREIPDTSFYVWIDQDRLIQVLDNLISNAIKYSPDGGKITFKIEKQIRQIVVSIKDEGIGIEYDKLDKIFDRFYRVDRSRTRELGGTGLGLAITQELIDAHYGQIWAHSKVNAGTTIYFTLPLMNNKRRKER